MLGELPREGLAKLIGQGFLAWKVMIERADGHPCPLGDDGHGHIVVTLALEQFQGCLPDEGCLVRERSIGS